MWNANNSNFYAQIMDSLAGFFGLKAEDTTEAELHQKLTEAKTQVELAEAAKTEGLAAAAKEVEGLKADVARLTADLTAANSALATKVKEANTLAGEVARLTAGAKPKGVEAVDTDDQISKVPAGNGQMVKVKAFDEILN